MEPDRPAMDAEASGTEKAAAGPLADVTGAEAIKALALHLPQSPGVYRMLDGAGNVLYVGKAKNLKARVTAYTKLTGHSHRIARMISLTADMEFVRTQSEIEALLLEANLIKRLKPRFNIFFRDDKSFPHILLRQDHAFPQILKHRGAQAIKGRYFGPFASAGSVARTLNTLQRAFLLRSCSDHVFENRTRPCLLHQIKRCSAPCVGYISETDYAALAAQAADFLDGRDESVKSALSARMDKAAEDLDFETAANYRDRIRALANIQLKQDINPTTVKEADVIAAYSDGGITCIEVFFFRAGQNWGNRAYFQRHDKSEPTEEILEAFLAQFYDNKEPPKLILLSHDIPSAELLAEALTVRTARKIEVAVPQRGEKRDLIEHAMTNARDAHQRRLAETASQRELLTTLERAFGLPATPKRIEVYDNSHIQGTNAVGAMIVAGPDGFEKSQYRKFNIDAAGLTPGDDYAMMRQVLKRRFARLKKAETEGEDMAKFGAMPDLLLIDGGKGQLAAAEDALKELEIAGPAIVAIAKGEVRNAARERFFQPGAEPRLLEPNTPLLYFLQRLRDEAHRFAIGTHRAKRAKTVSQSSLDEIDGIGARRKRALLQHFGSARAVERAGLADLEAVEGISGAIARRIHDFYRGGS